jgi:hypothetical protein
MDCTDGDITLCVEAAAAGRAGGRAAGALAAGRAIDRLLDPCSNWGALVTGRADAADFCIAARI